MVEFDAAQQVYEFEQFHLDVRNRMLSRASAPVPLAPKVFDTLLALVERSGQVIEKEELLQVIWPDSFVEENNLAQNIFQLRKTLGQTADGRQYIETINRRGYRFVVEVRRTNGGEIRLPIPATSAEAPPVLPAEKMPTPTRRLLRLLGWAAAGVALLIGLSFWGRFTSRAPVSFLHPHLTKLTNTLDARTPVLSRDGKYLAFVVNEAGKQSVRVQQMVAATEVEVMAPAALRYRGLTFSPDGNFLYYTTYEKPGTSGVLARVPVLGGASETLNQNVDSPVTFSPDGQQLAFARYHSEAALIIANLDGQQERKLAVRQKPSYFSIAGLSWSPDGQLLACAVVNYDPPIPYMTLVGVDTTTGQEQRLTKRQFSGLEQVMWLPDGRSLMAILSDTTSPLHSPQVWQFSLSDDAVQRVTNDLSAYHWVTIAQAADQLVTVQTSRVAQLQMVTNSDAAQAREITFGSGDAAGEGLGLTMTPDGRIIYASHLNGNTDLWLMNADGSQRRQLTEHPGADYQPAVSPDGRYVLFASARAGAQTNIWRMELNGENAQQLTFGQDDENPAVTPDGKWVLYTTRGHGHWTLWRVPLAGGEAQPLTQTATQRPMVSPDGKLIACYFYDETKRSYRLAVLPIDGGQALHFFDVPVNDLLPVYWAKDGRALTYVDTREGVSNLWRQPIDGSAPQQMTQFNSGRIFRYAWAADGKTIVCERGTVLNDLVLIRPSR